MAWCMICSAVFIHATPLKSKIYVLSSCLFLKSLFQLHIMEIGHTLEVLMKQFVCCATCTQYLSLKFIEWVGGVFIKILV